MPGMQGMIITLAIVFLIGIIIGFYLRQARINELTEGLKRSQKRQEELEVEHQQRLQAATQQLQQDYEGQLAERIETYQAQYEARVGQLEADYQAQSTALASATAADRSPAYSPGADPGVEANLAVEQHLRRQYETRLREVAAKLQRAYEQHLRQKLAEARQAYDRDYEKRLTTALARHHDQRLEQPQELDPDVANRLQMMQAGASVPATSGLDGDQAARWRQEIEASVKSDYEMRLAEKIEHYQQELSRRTEELQQEMENRLQFLTQSSVPPRDGTAEESNLNLEDLINAAIDNTIAETALNSDSLDTLLGEATPEDEATAELLSSLEHLQDLNP